MEGTSCLQPAKTLCYADSNIHPLSLCCSVLMNTLQLPWFPAVVRFTLLTLCQPPVRTETAETIHSDTDHFIQPTLWFEAENISPLSESLLS